MVLREATYRRFADETLDRLASMERRLKTAGLDAGRASAEVEEVLQDAHSIKGTAAVLGVSSLAERAAAIERVLRPVAAGQAPVDEAVVRDVHGLVVEMRQVALAVPDPATPSTPPAVTVSGTATHTVLHIEDAAVVVELMRALLAVRPDVRLHEAPTARAGIELVRSLRPDLVFLDLNLPDGSGAEVLRAILDQPETAAIPVVVVSGEESRDLAERMVAAGAAAYVTKPFRAAGVRALVDRFCPAGG